MMKFHPSSKFRSAFSMTSLAKSPNLQITRSWMEGDWLAPMNVSGRELGRQRWQLDTYTDPKPEGATPNPSSTFPSINPINYCISIRMTFFFSGFGCKSQGPKHLCSSIGYWMAPLPPLYMENTPQVPHLHKMAEDWANHLQDSHFSKIWICRVQIVPPINIIY